MRRIHINTSAPYSVALGKGLLSSSGALAREVSETCKVCIVCDSNTHRLFCQKTARSFEEQGFDVFKIMLPSGEKTKSVKYFEALLEFLAKNDFTRSDMLVALGGGVIGDLTGFTAASYMRGIKYIQIPTTLLAAADSSVGGKTAIDLNAGKNLAGAFCQPAMVIYDTDTADTLGRGIFLDGLAEAAKAGIIADAELFEYIMDNDGDPYDLSVMQLAAGAIRVKAEIVEKDEFDTGIRQLLNFGHTAAHAIEKLSGFEVSHGRAVAAGMLISAKAALVKGWSREDCYSRIRSFLLRYDYDTDFGFTPTQMAEAAAVDKKRHGDKISIVIPLEIGECAIMDIGASDLLDYFKTGM